MVAGFFVLAIELVFKNIGVYFLHKGGRLMTLDEVKPGSTVKIVKNGAGGVIGQRLMDMGFFKGVTIKVIRNAPLVDPVEFLLGRQHVTVRHSEAATIEVESL